MPKVNLTAVIVTILVIAGALLTISLLSRGEERTINTSGNSRMSVFPDQASVSLLIQTSASSAEQAKNDNAAITDAVVSSLARIGIENKNIETENFNIYPEYGWVGSQQRLKGYVASNYIKVTTKDFGIVGKTVDASVDAGALVNYINFELSSAKQNEYKTTVLAEASKDARTKAEAIAQGLGKKLGSVVSVSASDYNYIPYPLYRLEEAASVNVKTIAMNIQPKSLDVSASVTVVYEIK